MAAFQSIVTLIDEPVGARGLILRQRIPSAVSICVSACCCDIHPSCSTQSSTKETTCNICCRCDESENRKV